MPAVMKPMWRSPSPSWHELVLSVDVLPELPRFLSAGGIIVSPRRLAQGCASAPPRAILSAAFDCSRTLNDHRIPAKTRSILRSNVRIYMDDMLSTIPYIASETDNGVSHTQMLLIEDILFSDSPQLTSANGLLKYEVIHWN
eukprot:SAG11_NODE_9770_length_881_cov_51.744246_1_plen_142_part_00